MQALLRRLEKRILVGLPDQQAREGMLVRLLQGRGPTPAQLAAAAAATAGYSGSDIACLAKEAAMR